MATNKITLSWGEKGELIATGTIRQPTIIETINAVHEQRFNCEGAYIIGVNIAGEWCPPEERKTLVLWPYIDICPVCSHSEMFYGPKCPVCNKPWNEK